MNNYVQYTCNNAVATITLDDPERLNCFSVGMVSELHAALDHVQKDAARHVIFSGAGQSFSSGFDLSDLDDESDADLLLRIVRIEQLLQRVRHLSCSTLVLAHGACIGAAAELIMTCRTRIATPTARFVMPGMRFGLVLGTRRLRDTLGEANAYDLIDRTSAVNAHEGLAAGFLTQVAEREEWEQAVSDNHAMLNQYTPEGYAMRVASLTPDTRDSDMAALVNSITTGSIKQRLQDYVKGIAEARG